MSLLETVVFEGREFITAHKLHQDIQPTSQPKNTMRAIRNMETYENLRDGGHIFEIDRNTAVAFGSADFERLVKSNSYNPVMILDRVAQKAIEHHFAETASQAVYSAKENALLAHVGINLELLSKDPHALSLLKAMSDAKEASLKAEAASKIANTALVKTQTLEDRVARMDGDSRYITILAFARFIGVNIPRDRANFLGRYAGRVCRSLGLPIGKVPDERYGKVNSYPKEVVQDVFSKAGYNA